MPITVQLGKPPGDSGPLSGWISRALGTITSALRQAPEMVVIADEVFADGVARELRHGLGRVPVAVLSEVSGGAAQVSVDAKTATSVTITVTTGGADRTLTITLLG